MKHKNLIRLSTQKLVCAFLLLFIIVTTFSCKKILSQENVAIENKMNMTARNNNFSETTLKSITNFDIGIQEDYGEYMKPGNGKIKSLIVNEFDRITTQTLKMDWAGSDSNEANQGKIFTDDIIKELNFAKNNNNLKVHGHTLLYWPSSPKWFQNISTVADLERFAKNFIQCAVRACEGSNMQSIDVANELFDIRDGRIGYDINNNINNTWFKLFGYNRTAFYHFIGRCFKWAREEDNKINGTNFKLFYNDFNHENYPEKRDTIYSFCKFLKDNNYPIDGIGLQFHLTLYPYTFPGTSTTALATSYDGITDAIYKATTLRNNSFLIHIAELDVAVDEKPDSIISPIYGFTEQWKQYDLIRHAVKQYRDIVPDNQKLCFTLWNATDATSWYRKWRNDKDYPTLFDINAERKLGYYGFITGASTTGQYFIPDIAFHLYNMQTGKYAEVENSAVNNTALMQQNIKNNSATNNPQLFKIINNGNGFYHIVNINSGKSLDHYDSTPFSLQQYDYGANNNQQFSLQGLSSGIVDGRFNIISKANGKYLEVVGNGQNIDVGVKLQVGDANFTNVNQSWRLEF
jgi:endo-1,4-beta-xylanase